MLLFLEDASLNLPFISFSHKALKGETL